MQSQLKWNCNGCRRQFSVKVGTIFEDSPIKLSKWLPAMWLITNAKNGISSCELRQVARCDPKDRVVHASQNKTCPSETGHLRSWGDNVEVDETYIGGKARNMHKRVREEKDHGNRRKGQDGRFPEMLERGGAVKNQSCSAT